MKKRDRTEEIITKKKLRKAILLQSLSLTISCLGLLISLVEKHLADADYLLGMALTAFSVGIITHTWTTFFEIIDRIRETDLPEDEE